MYLKIGNELKNCFKSRTLLVLKVSLGHVSGTQFNNLDMGQ